MNDDLRIPSRGLDFDFGVSIPPKILGEKFCKFTVENSVGGESPLFRNPDLGVLLVVVFP